MDFQKLPDLSLAGWVWDKKSHWSIKCEHQVTKTDGFTLILFSLAHSNSQYWDDHCWAHVENLRNPVWDSEKNLTTCALSERQVVSVDVLALVCFCITSGLIQVMRTEDLIFLSNSFFLPFRSGRKWPGIYSSHNGQWKGRLHWERGANPRRWWWRYTIWDSQTEAKDGYHGRDILWQMAYHSYQHKLSTDPLALSTVTCQVLNCMRS